MTIAHSLLFNRKAWAFPLAMGMPAGVWSATGDEEGDASGGSLTFQHIFSNPSNGLGDSNWYSIEHVMINSSLETITGATLTLNGMDRASGRVGTPLDPILRVYGFLMLAADVSVPGSATVRPNSIFSPGQSAHIWVGTYQGLPTDLGDVIVRTANPTGNDQVGAALYGYWWTPDAANAPLGLRRPAEYVFSP